VGKTNWTEAAMSTWYATTDFFYEGIERARAREKEKVLAQERSPLGAQNHAADIHNRHWH